MADALANHIKSLIGVADLTQIDEDGQPYHRKVRAGDFLILVQSRQRLLFREIHRACKSANLPIAGADRLKVAAELAVQDIRSLLAFLAFPDDDLSLAEALRSPLFGWTEQDLYTLAQGRSKKYLWAELRNRTDEYPQTLSKLNELRTLADYKRPFEVIEHILTRHGGRSALLARLGVEAAEGIDALISQSLAFERSNVPSMTGFLVWLDADDLEIKRQMDGVGDQIRVMTVHGAKGLEAPIVILPDTGPRRAPTAPTVIDHQGLAVWRPNSDAMPDALTQTVKSLQATQVAERDRLLYVALTRAESWLMVFGSGDIKDTDDCWYTAIRTAMAQLDAKALDTDIGLGLRYETADWALGPISHTPPPAPRVYDIPTWFSADAPTPEIPIEPRSPSDLGGAKVIESHESEPNPDALDHGTAVHLLLEILPPLSPDIWSKVAARALQADLLDAALTEVLPILQAPDLAHIFADDSLVEVDITAHLPALGDAPIEGSIDRLIVTQTDVLAIDYKTNQAIPTTPEDTPQGVLRQMGAYASALEQVFPNHNIRTAILWTKSATLMELPHDLVTRSLQNASSA
ncbi:MAG: 3'-5' exonuclease [Planktomarina sp.]